MGSRNYLKIKRNMILLREKFPTNKTTQKRTSKDHWNINWVFNEEHRKRISIHISFQRKTRTAFFSGYYFLFFPQPRTRTLRCYFEKRRFQCPDVSKKKHFRTTKNSMKLYLLHKKDQHYSIKKYTKKENKWKDE